MPTPEKPDTTTAATTGATETKPEQATAPQQPNPAASTTTPPAEDPLKAIMKRTLHAIVEDTPVATTSDGKQEPTPPAPDAGKEETKPEAAAGGEVTPPAADQKAEPKPDGQPAAPTAAAPAEKPKLTTEEIRDVVREVAEAMKPATHAAPAAEKKDEPKAEFLPEEQSEIDLAKFAAEQDGAKYGDLPAKFEDFYRRQKAFLDAQIQRNGSADLEGEEYQSFLKANKPKLSRIDRENLRVMQAKVEATKAAEDKIREAEERMQRQVAELRVEPVIKGEQSKTRSLVAEVLPEEVRSTFLSQPEEFQKQHVFEARVVEPIARDVAEVIGDFYRLSSGIDKLDLNKPGHRFIGEFITKEGQALDAQPEDKRRAADGRLLVSRQKYLAETQRDPAARNRLAYLPDEIIVSRLQSHARELAKQRLEQLNRELEAAGYKREAKAAKPTGGEKPAAPAPAAPKPATPPAPAAAPTRAPGVSMEKPKAPERSLPYSILNGLRHS